MDGDERGVGGVPDLSLANMTAPGRTPSTMAFSMVDSIVHDILGGVVRQQIRGVYDHCVVQLLARAVIVLNGEMRNKTCEPTSEPLKTPEAG